MTSPLLGNGATCKTYHGHSYVSFTCLHNLISCLVNQRSYISIIGSQDLNNRTFECRALNLNNKNWQSDYPTYVIKHWEKKHDAVTWVLHLAERSFIRQCMAERSLS
jgi:hypothetical protein